MEEQNSSKSLIIVIIIAIILAAGCGVGGYYLGSSSEEKPTPEVKTEETEEKEEEKTNTIEHSSPIKILFGEETDDYWSYPDFLLASIVEPEISDCKLLLEKNVYDVTCGDANYELFTAEDGNRYLRIWNEMTAYNRGYDLIVNNKGENVFRTDYYVETEIDENYLRGSLFKADNEKSLAYIEDGAYYYPVFVSADSYNPEDIQTNCKVRYKKVSFVDGKAKEEETDIEKTVKLDMW